ncbi:MAG: outer membrane beta-barrel protein [Holophagae bacterium]|jgi:hypothetical protein
MKTHLAVAALLVLGVSVASAADQPPLSYTYVEGEYAIDSSIEIYGNVSDSDNAFSVGGSWRLARRFVLWGRAGSTSYDLPNFGEHLDWKLGTVGVLYRLPIREGTEAPLDALVGVSYEYLDTEITTQLDDDSFSDSGLGLRAGLKAGIATHFEVAAFLHYYDYGVFDEGFRNHLDGLFFELGAELALTRRLSLIATYLTGEFDYMELPGLERPVEVEVDRDEVRLGVRLHFR